MTTERKIMLLLSALHKRGFERLRFSAGISPSGLHWRYEIAPAESFNADGATIMHELYTHDAFGSSNGKLPLFDWEGAEAAPPEGFADWFQKHFPAVAEAGKGADTPYAEWFEHVLELTAPEGLVVMYGEYHDLVRDGIGVLGIKRRVEVPLPLAP